MITYNDYYYGRNDHERRPSDRPLFIDNGSGIGRTDLDRYLQEMESEIYRLLIRTLR